MARLNILLRLATYSTGGCMIGLLLAACQGPAQPESNRIDGGDGNDLDADGDGYDAPADCDDEDRAVHPGTKESCGNGIDDNCNGTSDGCDWSGESTLRGTKIATDERGAHFGGSIAICDANGDGQLDIAAGAYAANDYSGAAYVFYGPIENDRNAKDADYVVNGTTGLGLAGFAIDCGGDWNGDGIGDLVVGEPSFAKGHTRGTIYVVPGGDVGSAEIADVATTEWFGTNDQAQLGYDVVLLDLDGSEIRDIAAPAAGTPHHQVDYGHVYVFADPAPGKSADVDATAEIYGTENDEVWGAGNAGDLDGDGLEDLAVSGRGSEKSDAAFIFRAPLAGAVSKADADLRIDDDGQGFGSALGHADLDDDGRDDFFVGDQLRADGAGAAYVFYGNVQDDTSTAAADVQLLGGTPASRVGCAIASPGDIDGDGKAELLIGAWQASAVYLQYGGDPGVYHLATDAQASWRREEKYAGVGDAIAAGDVSGDGLTDFAIAAPGLGDFGEGAVFLMPSFDL